LIPFNPKFSQTAVGYCLIISLLGVIIFANHLNNPFQFDSVPYISNNAKLQKPETLLTPEFLQKEFIHRGLLRISIALNVHLDGFKPFGFHLLSLAFHILNALLLFLYLKNLFSVFILAHWVGVIIEFVVYRFLQPFYFFAIRFKLNPLFTS